MTHVMAPDGGDGDWRQALTCTRLRDTTVRSRVATGTETIQDRRCVILVFVLPSGVIKNDTDHYNRKLY